MDDEMTEIVDDARNAPLSEVFALLDLDLAKGSWNDGFAFSIFHDERTPSLHVSGDHLWHDFSSGRGGDPIGLVQAFFGCSFMRAVQFISAGIDPDAVRVERERAKKAEEIPDLTDYFWEVDSRSGIRRGLDPEWVEVSDWCYSNWGVDLGWLERWFDVRAMWVGPEVQLWSPHYANDRVTGIKYRTFPDRQKRSVMGSKYVDLYRSRGWRMDTGLAWLVEGESDCWALTAHVGGRVFGLPSGAGMWRDSWVETLRPYGEIRLALDDDRAGNEATDRLTAALSAAGVSVAVEKVPGGRVAEALSGGWRP